MYTDDKQCKKVDLVLKNGRVFNPRRGIDYFGDLAVKNGKIVEYTADCLAKKTVDVKGNYIVPGLIDIHTHINYRGGNTSMPVDPSCLSTGVTAAVDAGSTGVSNCPALLNTLQNAITKTKIMLNVSCCGIIMATQFAEPVDPKKWDVGLFDEIFAEHGDRIIGLKIRASKNVVNELGMEPIIKGIELAERYGTRFIVHTTNPPTTMNEMAKVLRNGDVLTHMYQAVGDSCIDENNAVCKEYWAAKERGVIFDTAPGQGNFSLDVARTAIAQGFLPDSISTDSNINNWNHPNVYNLPAVMSKFMALGMSFAQVVDCATEAPAIQWGEENNMGCLLPGTVADLTVLENRKCTPIFRDKYDTEVHGENLLIPHMTVVNGKIWYQSMEMHPSYS